MARTDRGARRSLRNERRCGRYHFTAMRIIQLTIATLALALTACTLRPDARAVSDADAPESLIGQRVAVTGVAENWKLGPKVTEGNLSLWVDARHWPADVSGKRVEVVGVLEQRADLPAFREEDHATGELPQGIPVPEGSDIRKASLRYVLAKPSWRVIR